MTLKTMAATPLLWGDCERLLTHRLHSHRRERLVDTGPPRPRHAHCCTVGNGWTAHRGNVSQPLCASVPFPRKGGI